jgi:hypothetical protein
VRDLGQRLCQRGCAADSVPRARGGRRSQHDVLLASRSCAISSAARGGRAPFAWPQRAQRPAAMCSELVVATITRCRSAPARLRPRDIEPAGGRGRDVCSRGARLASQMWHHVGPSCAAMRSPASLPSCRRDDSRSRAVRDRCSLRGVAAMLSVCCWRGPRAPAQSLVAGCKDGCSKKCAALTAPALPDCPACLRMGPSNGQRSSPLRAPILKSLAQCSGTHTSRQRLNCLALYLVLPSAQQRLSTCTPAASCPSSSGRGSARDPAFG